MVLGHPNLKFIPALSMENFSNKQMLVFPASLDSVLSLGHYALPSLPNFRI